MLQISPAKGSRDHRVKRVGRGFSSGIGGRSTRGTKGQNARKSGNVRLGFEGGQMPLYRKVGKYGFNNFEFRKPVKALNIRLFDVFDDVEVIDLEFLVSAGLIGKKDKFVKLIGDKTQLSGVVFNVNCYSKKAKEVLEAANNTVKYFDQGK